MLEFMISTLVTLTVVVDPLGLAPAFVAVTQDIPPGQRRGVAIRAAVIAAVLLAGTALAGNWLLTRLGITLPAFRIAGGLLLFAIAFEMVLGVRIGRETRQAELAVEERARHIAAFPLATPLMAGPGAITATLLLAGRAGADPPMLAALIAVVTFVCVLSAVTFILAAPVTRILGISGNVVLSRLLGIILAALAVQFVLDGVRSALAAL